MAYEKQEWKCGDVVTAEKLNHIEQGIADASGYECKETYALLTDESVTTVSQGEGMAIGSLAYEGEDLFSSDTIRVTFNGEEYICNLVEDQMPYYGATPNFETRTFDWSEYPFCIGAEVGLVTESAGTFQIKIETLETTAEITECFERAVKSVVSQGENEVEIVRYYRETPTSQTILCDHTYDEVLALAIGTKPVKFIFTTTADSTDIHELIQDGNSTSFSYFDGYTISPYLAVQFAKITHEAGRISREAFHIKSAT